MQKSSPGVEATVPPTVRETVDAVAALATDDGVMVQPVAKRLKVDRSTAARRLRRAADGGYVRNLEDRGGKAGRWVTGDPMPEDTQLLPLPADLAAQRTPGERETAGQPGVCTCAPVSEGVMSDAPEPAGECQMTRSPLRPGEHLTDDERDELVERIRQQATDAAERFRAIDPRRGDERPSDIATEQVSKWRAEARARARETKARLDTEAQKP